MSRASWRIVWFCSLAAGLLCAGLSQAQEAAAPAAAAATADPPSGFRKLAPGVETTIPAHRDPDDCFSTHDMVELLANNKDLKWEPYSTSIANTLAFKANAKVFARPVWNLEFSFKPLRMIYIDVPGKNSKAERELVWYMVYRVKNTGRHLKPVQKADASYDVEYVDYDVRFLPQFTLESHEFKKAYRDKIMPLAIEPIQKREDSKRKLLNSVEISKTPIPVSKDGVDNSVWGVVTWSDIDLQIDFFSIYVQGLSSGYRWEDPPKAYTAGSPPASGRKFTHKALELNFWRAGDEFFPTENEIYLGVPEQAGIQGKVDYSWVYR